MIKILKETFPVAHKEHKCMYCGCVIPVGERYRRTTNLYDGDIYDWVTHEDCEKVAQRLDMYNSDYDGLDDSRFQEEIDEYLSVYYYDEEMDDIRANVAALTLIEQVRLILADWDKPFIKAHRLKRQIILVKHQLIHGLPTEFYKRREEYLKRLEEELKETEEQL